MLVLLSDAGRRVLPMQILLREDAATNKLTHRLPTFVHVAYCGSECPSANRRADVSNLSFVPGASSPWVGGALDAASRHSVKVTTPTAAKAYAY